MHGGEGECKQELGSDIEQIETNDLAVKQRQDKMLTKAINRPTQSSIGELALNARRWQGL